MDKYLALVNKESKFDKSMLEDLEMTEIKVNMSKDKEFVNVETNEVNVIYQRGDGTYGIVIPE